MAVIISGKAVSAKIRESLRQEAALLAEQGVTPGLAVILVGDNDASRRYVNNKKKGCEEIGLYSQVHELPTETTEAELLDLIARLNADANIDGILVQLPLPAHIDEKAVIKAINPDKDVDAFHEQNAGRILLGNARFLPCTPAGIMELLVSEGIDPSGKEAVVIGRSNIVGKPMAMLLLQANATVTICHSKTKNLPDIVRRADIVVAAVGRPKFVTADMVKPGAVVIDVGMDRDENGRLCGDVDFEAVKDVAGYITPVPGGVGPMTITMLLKNTITAARAWIS